MASPSANVQRPCPYCGTWNQPDFTFCQKCGRQLPTPAATPVGVPAPAPAAPSPFLPPAPPPPFPAAAPPLEDTSVVERPLTDAEHGLLKRSAKNGPAGMLRFFGAFVGIVPLFMIGMAAMGTPFVPENYIAIVLVAGFLGAVLGGASQGLRMPLVRAASGGRAYEVCGVPEVQAAPGNQSLVGLGGLTFRMGSSAASRLLPDRMNRVTFADGGPTAGAKRRFGSNVAVMIEANGATVPKAESCYLIDPAGAATAAIALGGKLARGR